MRPVLDVFSAVLTVWLRLMVRYPRIVLGVAALLSMVSAVLAITGIRQNPSMNAVLGHGHRFNELYENYVELFGENEPLIAIFPAGHQIRSRSMARELVDELSQPLTSATAPRPELIGHKPFPAVMLDFPPPSSWWLANHELRTVERTLFRLEPLRDALNRDFELLADEAFLIPPGQRPPEHPLLWSDVVSHLTADVRSGDPRRIERAYSYLALLEKARTAWPAAPSPSPPLDPDPYAHVFDVHEFWSWAANIKLPRGTGPAVGLVFVQLYPESTEVEERFRPVVSPELANQRPTPTEALDIFQRAVERLRANYTEVNVGLTGRPMLKHEELSARDRDSIVSAVVAFVLVVAVVVLLVKRIRLTVAISVALACAVMWTLAVVAIFIGELNVLSATFVVVLCATGVDFGIHLGTSYDHRRLTGEPRELAIQTGFSAVGRSVIAGGLTTAVAFASTLVADFQAIVELGIIASVGMLFCMAAMFTVLPALLAQIESTKPRVAPRVAVALGHKPVSMPSAAMTLLVVIGVTGAGFVIGTGVGFNPNLLQLQDQSSPAVVWVRYMQEHSGRSTLFGVSIADTREQAAELIARFEARPDIVKAAEYLPDFLPTNAVAKRDNIRQFFAGRSVITTRDAGFRPDLELQRLLAPALTLAERTDGTLSEISDRREKLRDMLHRFEANIRAEPLNDALRSLKSAIHLWIGTDNRTGKPFAVGDVFRSPIGQRPATLNQLRALDKLADRWIETLAVGPPMPGEELVTLDDGRLIAGRVELMGAESALRIRPIAPQHRNVPAAAVARITPAEPGRLFQHASKHVVTLTTGETILGKISDPDDRGIYRIQTIDLVEIVPLEDVFARAPAPLQALTLARFWLTANMADPAWQTLIRSELAELEGLGQYFPTSLRDIDPAVRSVFLSRPVADIPSAAPVAAGSAAETGAVTAVPPSLDSSDSDDPFPGRKWLVQVYPTKDIYEEAPRQEFLGYCLRIDPDFTGVPRQYQRGLELMRDAFNHSGLVALVGVVILLLFDLLSPVRAIGPLLVLIGVIFGFGAWIFDLSLMSTIAPAFLLAFMLFFRTLYPVLLALLPLAVAIGMTRGAMALLGLDFNPANIIVLPALLGIGIDIGIHLVHAARREGGHVRILVPGGLSAMWQDFRALFGLASRARRRPPIFEPTARAVLVTTLTTMAGFGSLVFAGHAGMRSLGIVFAIAIFFVLIAGFTVLPAITRLHPLRRQ